MDRIAEIPIPTTEQRSRFIAASALGTNEVVSAVNAALLVRAKREPKDLPPASETGERHE